MYRRQSNPRLINPFRVPWVLAVKAESAFENEDVLERWWAQLDYQPRNFVYINKMAAFNDVVFSNCRANVGCHQCSADRNTVKETEVATTLKEKGFVYQQPMQGGMSVHGLFS